VLDRGVNRSDFAFTISSTMCFRRIRSGSDNDRMRIRQWIYLITDSERKWIGLGTETKLIGLVCLKVVNNKTTKNTYNKNGNTIK
jgi:hypothetical protein